jgi:uncharacterized protein (TIGR02145 family)
MKSIKNLIQILMLLSAPLLLQNCQSLADVIARGNSANDQIKNLDDPTDAQDAATKAYVDELLSIIQTLQNGVIDSDCNNYNVVIIGNQIWMAENLKTTKYNDGTPIPLITDNTAWGNLTTPGYCWYDNDQATYGDTYGALYNWYTVETGKLCPVGWHVPTHAEWTTLCDYLGGEYVAGGKLKEECYEHWNSPNEGATNETGFTALPGGHRFKDGTVFVHMGSSGYWWTTTEYFTYVYYWAMSADESNLFHYDAYKEFGYSVRCLKD